MINHSKILTGSFVQLEPMFEAHKQDLHLAAQDESIWTYNSVKAYGDKFYRWYDSAMNGFEAGQQLPFVVRRLHDHKIIGSTRFYDINAAHKRLTIGYTWYVPEVWGTYVNPESKLLLMTFAFEVLQVNRVEFVTDSRNLRSRAAIKKLGALEEGILRHHIVLEDGFIRDTVVFSIIQGDWPSVKLNLLSRLKVK